EQASAAGKGMGQRAGQIGMVEPGLQDVGLHVGDQPCQRQHPARQRDAAAHAQRMDGNAGLPQPRPDHALVLQADHHIAEAAMVHPGDELLEHALGAAGIQAGDEVEDADGHYMSGPATSVFTGGGARRKGWRRLIREAGSGQAILDSYYAALKAGDFAALERLLTPGVCVRYYGPPGLLPWGGVHEGFDAYRRFLGLVREHLEIIEVVQEAVIAEGEWIVVLGRGAWRARATTRHHRQHDQCL